MGFTTLLDVAFERGCGITRSRALKSTRYHELLDTSHKVTHVSSSEIAEMIYLGECLADKAFTGLPYRIRQDAMSWSTSTEEEQWKKLERLFEALRSKNWRKIRKIQDASIDDDHIANALPHERGSWARGPHIPNCLGVSQSLIGYARAAGANHLMVDVVIQYDQATDEQLLIVVDGLIKLLEVGSGNDPHLRTLKSKLETRRRDCLRSLVEHEKRRQAHHALAIQLGDEWVVVDPYLGRLYSLGGVSSMLTRWLPRVLLEPRRTVTTRGKNPYDVTRSELFDAFRVCLKALKNNSRATGKPVNFLKVIGEAASLILWFDHPYDAKVGADASQKSWHDTLYYSLLTHKEFSQLSQEEPSRGTLRHRLEKVKTHRRDRHLAIVRVMYYGYRKYLAMAYSAYHDRTTEHPLIQVLHPSYHLAIMTINHIGGHTKQPVIELVRYDNSQWIIHDTLKEVSQSQNSRYHRISARQFRMLRSLHPSLVMPALRLRLSEEEKSSGSK